MRWPTRLCLVLCIGACADTHRDTQRPQQTQPDSGVAIPEPATDAGKAFDFELDLKLIRDEGCDGVPESCRGTVLDARGRVMVSGDDDDCDGMAEHGCQHSEYDDNGYPAYRWSDLNCDGVADGETCLRQVFDQDGNVLSYEMDRDCDGAPEECRRAEYDESGFRTLYARDEGCDGRPDSCETWVPNEDDPMRGFERHDDCTAEDVPLCRWRVLDEQGRSLEHGDDYRCDGVIERRCASFRERDDGSLYFTIDDDCNGVPEKCSVRSETPTRLFYGSDDDCDGTAEARCHEVLFDERGIRTTEIDDDDCDGVPNGFLCAEFMPNGGSQLDFDCDGVPETCYRPLD